MWSNHPEHSPVGQEAKWLEEVRCGRTMHPELIRSCPVGLHHSGSRRFSVVEQSQTH